MKKIIIAFVFIFIICIRADAYDESKMHPLINLTAALHSSYFINILHLLGYSEIPPQDILDSNKINGQTIKQWLRDGGTNEDNDIRWLHHFHDPTRTWDIAGLGGATDRYSSLLWAQNKQTNNTLMTNNWSWLAARTYYHQALTGRSSPLRDDSLAKGLRSLGQVMHLLADAAVPEHTRDDMHPLGSRYEMWSKDNAAQFATNSGSTITYSIVNAALIPDVIPISNFWDTTPAAGYGGTLLGLAEYTNYNFLSPHTIFINYTYPFNPQKMNHQALVGEVVKSEDGKFDNRLYFNGMTSDGRIIKHLVSTGYLWSDLENMSVQNMDGSKFVLDEFCFKDYASILVPKAVDYNAALLDYFFRGTLAISAPDIRVYGLADGSQTPYVDGNGNYHQQFTRIRAKVMNTTPNEAFGAGLLQAVAKYRIIPNYAPDLSNYPPSNTLMNGDGTPDHLPVQYSYSVSAQRTLTQQEIAAMNAGYVNISFDFTQSSIPAGITDLTLQVVFKGTIGNEADNAIAVGMRDLSEPTHMVFWNLSDRFSYGDTCPDDPNYYCYNLYTKEQIDQNHDLKELLTARGVDYTPDTFAMTFAFANSPSGSITPLARASVPAGGHIRLIALADDPNSAAANIVQYSEQYDNFWDAFSGAFDQTGPDGSMRASPTTAFRFHGSQSDPMPFIQHYDYELINCYPSLSDGSCVVDESQEPPADPTPVSVQITMP